MKKFTLVLAFVLIISSVWSGNSAYSADENSKDSYSITIGRLENGKITFPIRKNLVTDFDHQDLEKLVKSIDTPDDSHISTPEQPFFFTKAPQQIETKLFELSGLEKGTRIWIYSSEHEPFQKSISHLSGFKWRCGKDYVRLQGQILLSKEIKGEILKPGGFGKSWNGEYVIISFDEPENGARQTSSGFDINQNGIPESLVEEHVMEDIILTLKENDRILFETSYGC